MPKNLDPSFDDVAELVDDPAFGEAPAPADLDLDAWLEGLRPARAVYPMMGRTIELEARSPERIKAVEAEYPDNKTTAGLAALADHIVDPEWTTERLARLNAVAPAEVAEMAQLATLLNTKARRLIPAAFLPGASV